MVHLLKQIMEQLSFRIKKIQELILIIIILITIIIYRNNKDQFHKK